MKLAGSARLARYLATAVAVAVTLSMDGSGGAAIATTGAATAAGATAATSAATGIAGHATSASPARPSAGPSAPRTVRRAPVLAPQPKKLAPQPKNLRMARVDDAPMRLRPTGSKAARMAKALVANGQAGANVPATPLAREDPGLAYDEAAHELVMFGGQEIVGGFLESSQDTWTWDGVAWRQQFPSTVPDPASPGGPAMTYDQAHHYVLLVSNGKTYTWDGSNWTQLSPAQSPPIAAGGTMVYDAAAGVDVLFGGECVAAGDPGCDDPNSQMSDATWTWDGSNWTMSTAGSPGRYTFCSPTAMTYDPATQQVVLDTDTFCTGSISNTAPFGTYLWNGQSWQFTGTGLPSTLHEPGGDSLVYDPATGTVIFHVLICGLPKGQDCFGTLSWQEQTMSWNGQQWSQVSAQESTPVQASSALYDPAVSKLVQFGGNLIDTPGRPMTSSTYGFTGSAWTSLDAVLDAEVISPGGDMNRPVCDCGQPINTASGNFWHAFTDFQIPGRGIPLNFSRTYNSLRAAASGRLGFGWTDSYSTHLSIDASTGNVTLADEGGDSITFTKLASGALEAPNRVLSTLTANSDGTFTLTRHDFTKLTFNSSGQLTAQTDRNGYQTTLTYSSGQLTTVTDPAGRTLTFSYNGSGQLASVTDPLGRSVSYGYDSSGNLTSATDPAGGTWAFSYDSGHHMLTMTDPQQGTWTNTYDSAGRITSQVDPMQRKTTLSYQGTATTMTDPRGIVTTLTYANGALVSKSVSSGQGQPATWEYAFNADMSPSTVTDPNGNTTQAITDANGNVISQTDARFHTTSASYNSFNEPTATVDANFVGTSYSYDANGNLTQVSTGGNTVSYTYGDTAHPGDATAMTDANGKTWTYGYDQFGDQTSVTDPLGDVAKKTYDEVGRVTSQTLPNGSASGADPARFTTKFSYDALDRLVSVTPPLSTGAAVSYTYDANGNQTSATDANGGKTQYSYDADNESTQVTRPDGAVLATSYDADGNVASQTDGVGQVTTFSYDALNQLVTATDPLGRVTQYTYDPAGNLATLTDARGQVTTYGYDSANNLTSVSYSDGKTPNVSFTYDNLGRRASMTDGTGTTHYSYDAFSRLTSVTNGAGATVSYTYDANGNPTAITYPGGTNQVKRAYDDAGRLSSVTDWLGNTVQFSYDADGNLIGARYPGSVNRAMTYDNLDQLASITLTRSQLGHQQTIFSASYAHSNVGELTSDGQTSYTYDPVSRLTQAAASAATSYGYDNADHLTSVKAAGSTAALGYDAAGQLQSITGGAAASFGYDANGNRTTTTPAGMPSLTAGFDQANRLTAWGTTASYSYNGDGLRASKTVSGTAEPLTWDLSQTTPSLLQDGTTSFIEGPAGQPLEQVGADGTVRYLQPDQLGSTRLLTDKTGAVVASYSYDAYGNTTASSGTSSTPLRYAGQFLDAESGLYYLRARYYDPATAQFITRDPVGSSGEPYSYAGDSPTNNVDDTGQSCEPATPPELGGGVQEFATFYVTINCWTEGNLLHWELTPYGYGVTRGKSERLNYQVYNSLGINEFGLVYDSVIQENERGIPLTAGKPLKEGTAACISGTWTFVLKTTGSKTQSGYNTFAVDCSGGGGGAPVIVGAAAILGLIAWLCSKIGKLPKPSPRPPLPWPPRPGPVPNPL